MQALIQDLLAYSRVNTTRQELRPTDAEDVLAAVERNLDLQLREAGAVLTHDPLPTVMADPLQLEQVFANLVSNAIKFRRPDEPLRIHVGARRLDGFWEFSVADNGIGIEPEYFDRIFVIFQRLHTKDAVPGHGDRPRDREADRRPARRHGPGRVDAGRGLDLLLHPAGRVSLPRRPHHPRRHPGDGRSRPGAAALTIRMDSEITPGAE